MRRVFSSHDLLAAHHARNLLESTGIRAEVRNERLASAMGELPPADEDGKRFLKVPLNGL